MRSGSFWVFISSLILLLGLLVWRVDRSFVVERVQSHQIQARASLATLAKAAEADVEAHARLMAAAIVQLKLEGRIEYTEGAPFGKFHLLASLLPPGKAPVPNTEWVFENKFFLSGSETKAWGEAAAILLLRNFKEAELPMGKTFLLTIEGPQKKPMMAMFAHWGNQFFLGILGPQVFQSYTDQAKGTEKALKLMFVNNLGQVLAHSTTAYIGTNMQSDPVVERMLGEGSVSGGGNFATANGAAHGFYEQVPQSNLFVMSSILESDLLADRKSNLISLLALGLAIILLGGVVFYVVKSREDSSFESVALTPTPSIPLMMAGQMQGAQASVHPPVEKKGDSDKERMEAFRKVASSLSHEIKGPIMSILGAVEILRGNLATNPSLANESVDKIEKQTRIARELTQKLLVFAGEEAGPAVSGKIEEALTKALKHLETKLSAKGVKVERKLESTPATLFEMNSMTKAFEALLQNSIEAMDRVAKKEIFLDLSAQENVITLTIMDSGEGMTQEEISKAFDPFYTTKSSYVHTGLGLPLALGVVREVGGEVTLQSEKGKGTTVTLTIPVTAQKVSAAPVFEVKALAATPPVNLMPPPPSAEALAAAKRGQEDLASAPLEIEMMPTPSEGPISSAATIKTGMSEQTVTNSIIERPIEKIIDEVDDEVKPAMKVNSEATSGAPAVPTDSGIHKTLAEVSELEKKGFSAKIDKPNIDFKKKTSRLESLAVPVRKPGDKA